MKNPTVQISGDASDLYARWELLLKVDIPDNVDINMNDTMTFKINSPVKFSLLTNSQFIIKPGRSSSSCTYITRFKYSKSHLDLILKITN